MKNSIARCSEAAWDLGCARGASAVTVRALADELGVSAALLYAHFDDKAALLAAVRQYAQPLLAAALSKAVTEEPRIDALARLCLAYVEFMREHAWLYCALVERLPMESRSAFLECACALLDEAPHPDSQATARALHLWIGVHGLALVCHGSACVGDSLDSDQSLISSHVHFLLSVAQTPSSLAS